MTGAKSATAPELRTIEISLSPDQRRSLSRGLTTKWPMVLVVAIGGGIVTAIYIASVLGPDGRTVGPAAGAAFAILAIGALFAKSALLREDKTALRSIGYFRVERHESGLARFVRVGRRKVWFDKEMPDMPALGAIDCLKREAYTLALFDTTGALRWTRSGYETVTTAFDLNAGTLETR